jgi:hypothetical protein
MSAIRCCATTLALAATTSFSPAMARSEILWRQLVAQHIQPVEHDAVPAHSASPSFLGPSPHGTSQKRILVLPFDPEAVKIKPHYVWQYRYEGRHAHWEGHWVLVMAPIQSAAAPMMY